MDFRLLRRLPTYNCMKFNHVCISGNDFNCVLPDTISAGTGSDAICEWEYGG